MKQCEVCSSELQGNQQKYCSNACKQKAHWYKLKEQPNTYHSQTIRGLARKVEFINLKGGSCNLCGYNKNITALEFHHRDSSTKDFSIDIRKLANTKKETLLLELEKCDLICANCHREHHYPEMLTSNVLNILRSCNST